MTRWVEIHRGTEPLLVCFPHTGSDLPAGDAQGLASPWLALRDTDWHVDRLYDFACALGATTVRTRVSRSIIDCNRDPSGLSLYPGQATTGLCPLTTFDGDALYSAQPPGEADIEKRLQRYFHPYHQAVAEEIARLRATHPWIVLYDAHSIRSRVPILFEGELPQFNIGTNGDASCDPRLTASVAAICAASGHCHVVNGRFRGGWTTRHYGQPGSGVHAIQMELAMRGYLIEPAQPDSDNWPPPWAPAFARPMRDTLQAVLKACLEFASEGRS